VHDPEGAIALAGDHHSSQRNQRIAASGAAIAHTMSTTSSPVGKPTPGVTAARTVSAWMTRAGFEIRYQRGKVAIFFRFQLDFTDFGSPRFPKNNETNAAAIRRPEAEMDASIGKHLSSDGKAACQALVVHSLSLRPASAQLHWLLVGILELQGACHSSPLPAQDGGRLPRIGTKSAAARRHQAPLERQQLQSR
jgi:hypothetical protein